jgi:hypothetical protein
MKTITLIIIAGLMFATCNKVAPETPVIHEIVSTEPLPDGGTEYFWKKFFFTGMGTVCICYKKTASGEVQAESESECAGIVKPADCGGGN